MHWSILPFAKSLRSFSVVVALLVALYAIAYVFMDPNSVRTMWKNYVTKRAIMFSAPKERNSEAPKDERTYRPSATSPSFDIGGGSGLVSRFRSRYQPVGQSAYQAVEQKLGPSTPGEGPRASAITSVSLTIQGKSSALLLTRHCC